MRENYTNTKKRNTYIKIMHTYLNAEKGKERAKCAMRIQMCAVRVWFVEEKNVCHAQIKYNKNLFLSRKNGTTCTNLRVRRV